MASVTFSASVGGDGSTVTDDTNATTGLDAGGHRTRFVPALAQVVAIAAVVVSNVQSIISGLNRNTTIPPGGRLTLTTATPVTIADVTAAGTLYYTPDRGNGLPTFNGTYWTISAFTELSLALDSNAAHTGYHQSGKNFDGFGALNVGSPVLGTGPAWSSDTARGTGAGTTELEFYQGQAVNKNSITLRIGSGVSDTITVAARQATYLGTIRCTANGQTEDSKVKRFVWNAYNRRPREMLVKESTASWTYTLAAYRQANGNAANQLAFIRGLDEDAIKAVVIGSAANSTAAPIACNVSIGLDSTTASSSTLIPVTATTLTANNYSGMMAEYMGYPGLGYHYLAWLESSAASGTTTWAGILTDATKYQSGIQGMINA